MGSAGVTRVMLNILNVLFVVFGLALAAGSIWFLIQVNEITSLRNKNHYLLDYTVYWPQAIPWLFLVVAVFVLFASCCGFTGARKRSRGLLFMYITFVVIVIVALAAVAVIALIFADNKSTDEFVKDTIWDAYYQSKTDPDVATAFGEIEKRLHCCGAGSPRDYKNWKDEFPVSCCDKYSHGWLEPYAIDCEFGNKLANERHGCSTVVSQYAKIGIKVLSGLCVLTAFIGVISIIVAVTRSSALKKKSRVLTAQHESESKKVLL